MDHFEATTREIAREHQAALDVLRVAKNAFFWLVVAAVALHLVTWSVVQFGGDRDAYYDEPASLETGRGLAQGWVEGLGSSLAVAGFIGRASALIVASIFVVSLLVSLSAKLGGAADLARACVWSLAALALVTPWAGLPSALSSVDEFYLSPGGEGAAGGVISLVRFGLCPVLVVACLVLGQVRFRRAHRRITRVRTSKLPIREV